MYSEKKLSYYITKSKTLECKKFEKKIRIAILSSFTLNGLIETLKVKCAEQKVECVGFASGYNQYNQDILNKKSILYNFSPDLSFLILDTRTILGSLFYSLYSLTTLQRKEFIENKVNQLIDLARTFVKTSQSKLVISNLVIPTYSPFGIFETKTEFGVQEMIQSLNIQLANKIINEPSIYLYDFNGFVTRYGEKNMFDYRQFFYGDIKISFNYIPFLAHDLMGYIKPILGLNRKCIVLDLDNTLWGGVVGEDGFDGIKIGDDSIGRAYLEFQKRLLSLHERGMILAINSKNNYDDAIKILREHPNMILHEEHFACLKINWNDKVSNMKEIADELNIGLDSMAFFDDDPVNREFIKTNVSQLTLKTNQFNLTTQRYQEEEIRKFINDPNKIVGCAQVVDKFGYNGITGVFIVNKDNSSEWTLDTFLLSCRVMGRGVEDGMLNHIITKAKNEGVKKLIGRFISTKKNKPAENFLPNFGFNKEGNFWTYSIEKPTKEIPYLTLSVE